MILTLHEDIGLGAIDEACSLLQITSNEALITAMQEEFMLSEAEEKDASKKKWWEKAKEALLKFFRSVQDAISRAVQKVAQLVRRDGKWLEKNGATLKEMGVFMLPTGVKASPYVGDPELGVEMLGQQFGGISTINAKVEELIDGGYKIHDFTVVPPNAGEEPMRELQKQTTDKTQEFSKVDGSKLHSAASWYVTAQKEFEKVVTDSRKKTDQVSRLLTLLSAVDSDPNSAFNQNKEYLMTVRSNLLEYSKWVQLIINIYNTLRKDTFAFAKNVVDQYAKSKADEAKGKGQAPTGAPTTNFLPGPAQ